MLLVVISVFSLILGCSGEKEASNLTMDKFIEAYTSQGIEVDKNEKPLFEMIGAIDGVIFYYDNSVVKIYQFESEKKLNQAKKDNEMLKDWVSNGNYLLETKKQEAVDIFKSVK
ncbi:hypothetical protein D3C74_232090 [compost metagenome]